MSHFHITRSSLPLVAAAILLLPACTTASSRTMDNGQRLSQRGESVSERGAEWAAGQKEMANGQKLIAQSDNRLADAREKLRDASEDADKAQRQIDEANADRLRGEKMVNRGTQQMYNAEADYREIRNDGPAIQPR